MDAPPLLQLAHRPTQYSKCCQLTFGKLPLRSQRKKKVRLYRQTLVQALTFARVTDDT